MLLLYVLTFLELETELLVVVVVFLLAFDVAIVNDSTIIAQYRTRFEADRTDCEVLLQLFTHSHLIGYLVLVVTSIWIRS